MVGKEEGRGGGGGGGMQWEKCLGSGKVLKRRKFCVLLLRILQAVKERRIDSKTSLKRERFSHPSFSLSPFQRTPEASTVEVDVSLSLSFALFLLPRATFFLRQQQEEEEEKEMN